MQKKNSRKNILTWIFIVCSSATTIFAFPPYKSGYLVWVSLFPFIISVFNAESKRAALNIGFAWGFIFFAGTVHWLCDVVGPLGIVLLAMLALFPAITAMLAVSAKERYGLITASFFMPVIWTGIEFFRCELWPLRFAFSSIAYSQYNYLKLIQISDIFGAYGVTFLIVAFNSALGLLVLSFVSEKNSGQVINKKQAAAYFAVILLLMLSAQTYGSRCLSRNYYNGRSISIVGVQSESDPVKMTKISAGALAKNAKKPELLVWPEYSLALFIDEMPILTKRILGFAKEHNIYLLFGGKEQKTGGKETDFYNTAFLISPGGKIVGRAVKMNPVQFHNDGIPGRKYSVLEINSAHIGVGICYDMDFSNFSRMLTVRGAEAFIFPTLDLPTKRNVEQIQHTAISPFRAIENRRFLLRVAATGISQLVSPSGRVIKSYGPEYSGIFAVDMKLSGQHSFYSRFGYLFSWVCLFAAVAQGLFSLFIKRQSK